MTPVDIDVSDIMKDITMQVNFTGLRQWRVRMAIAIWLMHFVGWLIGMGIEIVGEEEDYPFYPIDARMPKEDSIPRTREWLKKQMLRDKE